MESRCGRFTHESYRQAYLETGGFDRHLRQMRLRLEDNASTAFRCIARYFPKGTKVTRPQGGYFLWVELPPDMDALDVHRRAVDSGISVAPGHLFSADQRFRHHLRLNYGFYEGTELATALQQLGTLLISSR